MKVFTLAEAPRSGIFDSASALLSSGQAELAPPKLRFGTPENIIKEIYFKKPLHTPAHLFLSDYYYFITAGCYRKKKLIDCDVKKEFLYKIICKELKRYFAELHGWVVLDNHYHILAKLKDAFLLPRLIQTIHSKSAIQINRMDKQHGRKVWYDYWDDGDPSGNASEMREIFGPS